MFNHRSALAAFGGILGLVVASGWVISANRTSHLTVSDPVGPPIVTLPEGLLDDHVVSFEEASRSVARPFLKQVRNGMWRIYDGDKRVGDVDYFTRQDAIEAIHAWLPDR